MMDAITFTSCQKVVEQIQLMLWLLDSDIDSYFDVVMAETDD
jgi:hypothetical protein